MKALTCGQFRAIGIIFIVFFLQTISGWAMEKGQVTGQVKDAANNIYLSGVLVSAEDGQVKSVTDRNGKYSLSLEPGEQEIQFIFLGYEPIIKNVPVSPGTTSELNIDFGQTSVKMEEFVVKGHVVGQAKSLNQQKNAPNLTNVVASDAIGRFPDQNAAEALDRIPGISIERDQGEGRFVIIRGIDPHLNSASVDGVSLASAEAGTRAVLLDTLPMNVMESLVVTKAMTADMPSDSIGGHVDIVSPSAYDRSERTLHGSLGTNYSDLTEDLTPTGQMTYGDVFGSNKEFGFLASVSYDERKFGSDNIEADPWEKDDNDFWVTEELQYREYDLTRERLGITANLEYKPTVNNKFFVRGLYGSFTDHEYRRRSIISDMFMSATDNSTGAIFGEDYPDDASELFPTTELQLKDREETQRNWMISLGGENRAGSFIIDYTAAFSYAEQDTPFDTQFNYETDQLNYAYKNASTDTPSALVNTGNLEDLSIYEFDSVENSWQKVEEEAFIFAANIEKKLNTSFQSSVKTGFHISLRNKTNDLETRIYENPPTAFETLAGMGGTGRKAFSSFPLVTKGARGDFNAVKNQFSEEVDIEASNAEDYETDENIYGVYLMGEVGFERFSLLPGLRLEMTELEARGTTFDEETEDVGTQKKKNDYNNLLPSLHAKINFTDNLIMYAAWTNTISRPQWEQTRYGRFTDDDGDVELGNPDLDPYEAMNWDMTVTYYMPASLGMASMGFFFKDIDNFIYAQTKDVGYDLTTYENGDSGQIYGVELVYQQNLNFLPAPLRGFSFEGNLTISDSEADVLAPEEGDSGREIEFVRNSDMVSSLALSYEKNGFFIRLSGSYRSEYLDEIGEEPAEDRYIDEHFQLDLSSSYTFMEKYTIFANVINLTDEPLKAYWGESKRLSQYEEYGWYARMGMKFNF